MYKVQDKISSLEQHLEMESSSNTDNELVPFEQLPYWIKFCYKYSSLRPSKKMKCITALLDLVRIPGFCCLCVGLAGGKSCCRTWHVHISPNMGSNCTLFLLN